MKGSFTRSAFFSIAATLSVALSPGLVAQELAPDAAPETARRQLAMRDAMQEVQEARTAYTEKKYTQSVEHYRNALSVLPKAPATEKQERFIKDSLSDALIASAMDYRAVGRRDEAVAFLKEAMALAPQNKRAEAELLKTEDAARTNPALTPQHVGNVAEVERLLALGHGALDAGKYDEAVSAFAQVLKIDAYNTAARRGMESVQKRRSAYYQAAHDSARAAALAQVDAQWEEPVPDESAVADFGTPVQGEVADDEEMQQRIASSLREMVLPQVVFEDVPVTDVVDALQAQISRFENAAGMQAGRHINLTANFGLAGSEGYESIMARRVSLNLANVSLTDVLDALARQIGITYHVTPLGVELSYSGRDFGPMVERVYTVAPHFFDAEVGGQDDDDDDDFSSSSSRVVVKRVNPVVALKEMGISFPEGSNARYDVASRRLTVRNTPYNQEEIAGLLSVPLDVQERSVVLNVIAMEVNEKDLKDLGFEWLVNFHVGATSLFTGGGVVRDALDAGWVNAGGVQGATEGVSTISGSITEGLRSGTEALTADNMERLITTGSANRYGQATMGAQKSPGILSLRGVWQAGDVTMVMRGLAQKKGSDILYNPRLVLSPGEEQQAIFTNVREMFYPETYSEPQISSTSMSFADNNSSLTRGGRGYGIIATAAHPEEFTRFGMSEDSVGGIGAVVQVHDAQIAQDGQVVTLALTVTLNDFEGFINWGTPIRSFIMTDSVADIGGTSQGALVTLTENHILKPVFKRHMENTKISVAPGSVIVMGGLQEGRSVRYEDKLPILGDLPMVGRLFRSEGSDEVRKAFLFFVKVDVVDPTGRDPRTGSRPTDLTAAE